MQVYQSCNATARDIAMRELSSSGLSSLFSMKEVRGCGCGRWGCGCVYEDVCVYGRPDVGASRLRMTTTCAISQMWEQVV